VKQGGAPPGDRHSSTLSLVGDVYYLIGGTNKNVTYPTIFTFSNGIWAELPQPDVVPPARWGHTAIVYYDLIIVFGGYIVGGLTNDIWIYNTSTNQWSLQPVTGSVPIARAYHCATLVGHDMFILGGEGANNWTNDLHILNLDNWEWRRPETSGTVPSPKKRHSAVLVNNSLYIWGGWCQESFGHLQTLDILNLENFEWRRVEQFGSVPSPRAGHICRLRGNLFFCLGRIWS